MYEHSDQYLQRARRGRQWVKQYLAENLAPKYRSLVVPKTVILGKRNKITNDYLITDSKVLFEKYRLMCAGSATEFIEL